MIIKIDASELEKDDVLLFGKYSLAIAEEPERHAQFIKIRARRDGQEKLMTHAYRHGTVLHVRRVKATQGAPGLMV